MIRRCDPHQGILDIFNDTFWPDAPECLRAMQCSHHQDQPIHGVNLACLALNPLGILVEADETSQQREPIGALTIRSGLLKTHLIRVY